LLILKFTLAK